MTTVSNTSVLVVGGRTTGLMMASELARRSVPVRIVDASPGIDPHVRANLLHSRTLEIFHGLGLAERATEGGVAETSVRLHANGRLVAVQEHAPIDSPFPFGMTQSQARTEAVLEEHLNRHGVRVERSVELVALTQDEDRVVATLEHAEGRREVVETPWLIGCDGAHSPTRHFTGCAFPGDPDPFPYLLADVRIDGDLDESAAYLFLHEEGDLFVFTALPGHRRLVCASTPAGHSPSDAPTLPLMQALVDRRGLPGLRLSDPRWLTSFRIHYRLAPHYRHQRVFLAGDAAHVHSLLAGQGMNTGIQDAYNLAWKLALVLRGVAPAWWLDTYESERRRVGEEVVALTKTITEQAEAFGPLSAAERERLIAHMLVPAPDRLEAARHLQEVDLDYRSSALCSEPPGELEGGPHAGAQAPDAAPIVANGERQSLYRLLGGVDHHLLLFAGAAPSDRNRSALEQACHEAHGSWGEWMRVCVVATGEHSMRPRSGTTVLRDPEGALHARYGARSPCLYLIRPDGYVAYRGRHMDGLRAHLDRVLRS